MDICCYVVCSRFRSFAVGLVLVAALLPATTGGQEPAPSYGIAFSFIDVDISKVARCSTVSRGAPISGTVFITHYDQPEVRSRVRDMLAQMRQSGFEGIRLVLFFGPKAESPDWFDLDDSARAAVLVRSYVDDVKAAGFKEFYLVLGAQGTATPICRNNVWGDCYDPATMPQVVNFDAAVRQALGSPPILPLRIDVAPEFCAPQDLPQGLRDEMLSYSRTVVKEYSARFPADRITMSCSLARFLGGRESIDETFDAAGRSPSFYDIHAYNRPDQDEVALATRISKDLTNSQVPLVVGETTYGDRTNLDALLSALGSPTERVEAVYFWPLRTHSSGCHADVPPPYSLKDAQGAD